MHHSVHVCDKWKEKITLKTDYLAWKMALTQYLQISDDSDSITIFSFKKAGTRVATTQPVQHYPSITDR